MGYQAIDTKGFGKCREDPVHRLAGMQCGRDMLIEEFGPDGSYSLG